MALPEDLRDVQVKMKDDSSWLEGGGLPSVSPQAQGSPVGDGHGSLWNVIFNLQ